LLRSALHFLHHLRGGDAHHWRPLLAVHYLTYACGFRCPYCSDGAQQPYYSLRETPLDAAGNLELLRRVRAHCSHLVLTGGEPLLHPEVDDILEGLLDMRFRSVVFTTNGLELEAHLPALSRAVSELVVSLDTLDEIKADARYGAGLGIHRRILQGLQVARQWPGRHFRIVISAVATPENLDDLPELLHWCKTQGFRLAVCPQLVGVKAHSALVEDDRYRAIFDLLIREKRMGVDIHGTLEYLSRMRDLQLFKCRPLTLLATSPQGNVFYPCLEKGTFAGNLLLEPDLHTLRRTGETQHGPLPECDNRCHSACSLGFATLLDQPWELLREGWYQRRSATARD
jgi:MoaA/NifB/PqqE/SkfB family radical SAM enzyme